MRVSVNAAAGLYAGSVVATRSDVAAFVASWPGSALPAGPIAFEFDRSGDLVDVSPSLDAADGSAAVALSGDAQAALLRRIPHEFHIVTTIPGGSPASAEVVIRRHWHVAEFAFRQAVYAAIKAAAMLDRPAGMRAYEAAEAVTRPLLRHGAQAVEILGFRVTVEAVAR